MKSLAVCAGKGKGQTEKYKVQESEAKYWGTLPNYGFTLNPVTGNYDQTQKKFVRSDGSIGVDKTKGWHSRKGYKQAMRQANRAINKRARQKLKRQMLDEKESI